MTVFTFDKIIFFDIWPPCPFIWLITTTVSNALRSVSKVKSAISEGRPFFNGDAPANPFLQYCWIVRDKGAELGPYSSSAAALHFYRRPSVLRLLMLLHVKKGGGALVCVLFVPLLLFLESICVLTLARPLSEL